MANKRPNDSLNSLQYMLNDLTVQIGKALRASSKQPGRRDVSQVQSSLQSHIPNAIENFHWALDDLEDEIVRAKAALQRDLDKLQTHNQVQPEHPPVHAFMAQPMVLKASQAPEPSMQSQPSSAAPTAPMAPLPDMGGGMTPVAVEVPTPAQPDVKVKSEPAPSAPQALMEPATEDIKAMDQKSTPVVTTQAFAPVSAAPAAPEAMMDDVFGLGISRGGGNTGNAGEFNFTDITFGLAPSNTESQDQGTQQTDIDMSTFGNDDLSSLDNMLSMDVSAPPPGPVIISNAPLTSAPTGLVEDKAPAADLSNVQSTNSLDDIFDLDGDGGMDLSMDIGDGADGSNFDNVFFEDKFDESSEKYDEAFFHME